MIGSNSKQQEVAAVLKKTTKEKSYTQQKVFAEYLWKVNFSEKVRYGRDDRLAELNKFLIANFLWGVHLPKMLNKNLLLSVLFLFYWGVLR